ncbi:MAG: transposase [Pseudonocardiaceae bacterium]
MQTVVSSRGWTARTEDVPLRQLVAVPVDVGESSAMVMACDFTRRTLMPATEFPLTRAGIAAMLAGLHTALPAEVRLVRVGVEAPPSRWASAAKIYRASGLTPIVYASAGRRRDGGISREGSVHLRRALIELGIGLWQRDCGSRGYAHALRERGKPGGIISCALAHRANKIAYAMVRDQVPFDPTRWS